MKYKKKKKKKGFTLIELLAVIIILGVLMIIAIPSVTEYIGDSRRKAYITTAEQYIGGTRNKVNSLEYNFLDEDTTYYVPIKCIPLEKGGESPFGEWRDAYVIVTYNGSDGFDYYWTSLDSSGYKVEITNVEELNVDSLIPSSNELNNKIGIDGRKWIVVVDKDTCEVGEPFEAEENYGDQILANVVSIGDFVNYDAGVWEETIAKPTSGYNFGGYTSGKSRNNSVTCSSGQNLYNGWRVINVEGDVVKLVHAGTSECYYFPYSTGSGCKSHYILTGNYSPSSSCQNMSVYNGIIPHDWSGYVNSKYAVSSTSLAYSDLTISHMLSNAVETTYSTYSDFMNANPSFNDYNNTYRDECHTYYSYKLNDLYENGTYSNYWFGKGYDGYLLYKLVYHSCAGEEIHYTSELLNYAGGATKGLRPVVTLKARIKTSGQVEQVVGTNGTTKAMVWQLIEE